MGILSSVTHTPPTPKYQCMFADEPLWIFSCLISSDACNETTWVFVRFIVLVLGVGIELWCRWDAGIMGLMQIAAITNSFVIREVDPYDHHNFMFSDNLWEVGKPFRYTERFEEIYQPVF